MTEIKTNLRLVSSGAGNSGNKAVDQRPDGGFTGDVAIDVMMKVMDLLDGDADLAASTMLLAAAYLLDAGDLPGPDAEGRATMLKAAVLAASGHSSGTAS